MKHAAEAVTTTVKKGKLMPTPPAPKFTIAGPALVRIPLGSVSERDDPVGPETGPISAPPSPGQLSARVRALLADGLLMEAVSLASPSTALTCRQQIDRLPDKRLRSLAASLTAYSARMRERATPFGVFAGVSLAPFADSSRGDVDPPAGHRRVARPDAVWLKTITDHVDRSAEGLVRLEYIVNPAVLPKADHYLLLTPDARTSRMSLPASAPLAAVMAAAREWTCGSKIREVAEACGKTADEAVDLLRALVSHRFLLSELGPPAHSCDPLGHILGSLRRRDLFPDLVQALEGFDTALRSYAAEPLGEADSALAAVHCAGDVVMRVAGAQAEEGSPLQIDTVVSAAIMLGPQVREEAQAAAHVLARLSASQDLKHVQEHLNRVSGGYGVPLAEVACPPAPTRARETHPALLSAYAAALRENRTEIVLDDELLDAIAPSGAADPVVEMDLFAIVSAPDAAALDEGRFELHVRRPASSSAGTALARFAPALGREGVDALHAIARRVDRAAAGDLAQDALPADVTFHPRHPAAENTARVALVRPVRINTNGPSGDAQGPGEALGPEDLLLFAGPDGPEVWSKLLGMRVLPRAATALNTETAAPHSAHVLALVSGQNRALGFDWGVLRDAPWLPRIRRARTIFSPQTWRPGPDLVREGAADESWYERFSRWSELWSVPHRVMLVEGDRQIPLSLRDPVDMGILQRHALKGGVVLTESFGRENCWVRSPQGPHLTEVVFPMVVEEPPTRLSGGGRRAAAASAPPQRPQPSASVMPGESWLRASIACRKTKQPALLRTLARALVEYDWFLSRPDDDHLVVCASPETRGYEVDAWSACLRKLLGALDSIGGDSEADMLTVLTYPRDAGFGTPLLDPDRAERWAVADTRCAVAALAAQDPYSPLLSTLDLAYRIARINGNLPLAAIQPDRPRFAPMRRKVLPLISGAPDATVAESAEYPQGLVRLWAERDTATRQCLSAQPTPTAAVHMGALLLRQHAQRLVGSSDAPAHLALAAAADHAAASRRRATKGEI